MDDDDEAEYPCPRCGKPTSHDLDCPGFGGRNGERVMVCMGCGNADYYECEDHDGCGWWYREPNIRADKAKMGERPEWLAARAWS
jgi:hypothetical protein